MFTIFVESWVGKSGKSFDCPTQVFLFLSYLSYLLSGPLSHAYNLIFFKDNYRNHLTDSIRNSFRYKILLISFKEVLSPLGFYPVISSSIKITKIFIQNIFNKSLFQTNNCKIYIRISKTIWRYSQYNFWKTIRVISEAINRDQCAQRFPRENSGINI